LDGLGGRKCSGSTWFKNGLSRCLKRRFIKRLIRCDHDVVTAHGTSSETGGKAVFSAGARDSKSSIRLLLAEDNAVNQKVALRQLTSLGFHVHAVRNGLEAVQAIEREIYPIILMDCQMPEMDGYKATECIRLMQNTSPVAWKFRPYIIAMTANALAGDREACLAAGMDDYVSKPVRLEDLNSALQRGLEAMQRKPLSASQVRALETTARLVDAEALDNLRSLRMQGEPDPLAELVELFLSDTPSRIEQLHAAFKNCAAHDLEAAAHSLKGSAGNLGAQTIAAACARIMQAARAGDFGPVAPFIKSIEEDFEKVKLLLLEEMKR
jgi:CheY-like chemotaxis protein/HPt (histidine-containing phosphotransfer) domain-containing protein